jgi:hypothetical protein
VFFGIGANKTMKISRLIKSRRDSQNDRKVNTHKKRKGRGEKTRKNTHEKKSDDALLVVMYDNC